MVARKCESQNREISVTGHDVELIAGIELGIQNDSITSFSHACFAVNYEANLLSYPAGFDCMNKVILIMLSYQEDIAYMLTLKRWLVYI